MVTKQSFQCATSSQHRLACVGCGVLVDMGGEVLDVGQLEDVAVALRSPHPVEGLEALRGPRHELVQLEVTRVHRVLRIQHNITQPTLHFNSFIVINFNSRTFQRFRWLVLLSKSHLLFSETQLTSDIRSKNRI